MSLGNLAIGETDGSLGVMFEQKLAYKNWKIFVVKVLAREYSRLSFAFATTIYSLVVAGVHEKRLYFQATKV